MNKTLFYKSFIEQMTNIIRVMTFIEWDASNLSENAPISRDVVKDIMKRIYVTLKEGVESVISLGKDRERKQKAVYMLTRNFKIRLEQTF